jgi:hypothetical protein
MSEERKDWQYNRGVWEEVPSPFSPNIRDWDEAVRASGYRRMESVGSLDTDTNIRIYIHNRQDGYLCELAPGPCSSFTVLCPDMPSLLMFLRDYAPLVQRQVTSDFLAGLQTTMNRAFEAWHGHDTFNVCRQCDHIAVEQREIQRQAREERKRATKQPTPEAA